MQKSVPIAIVIAGLIIGGADIVGAWIQHPRYALGVISGAVVRMDVHSGEIDTYQPYPTAAAKIHDLPSFGMICLNEGGKQIAP